MVNVGMLVNRRMELKKQGKLHEELVSEKIIIIVYWYCVLIDTIRAVLMISWRHKQLAVKVFMPKHLLHLHLSLMQEDLDKSKSFKLLNSISFFIFVHNTFLLNNNYIHITQPLFHFMYDHYESRIKPI